MFFRQIINNIIFYMKQIFNFEKPLNAHILKTIDLKDKILEKLQLTIKNQSISEETKNIFSYLFKFVKDSNTEIKYDNIYQKLNEIYLKYSQNTMKSSTSNVFDNINHQTNSKNNLFYSGISNYSKKFY